MSYRTNRRCLFITYLAFKGGLVAYNHNGLLIVRLITNIFPFYFQTTILYAFYALGRPVLTHCKLMIFSHNFSPVLTETDKN